MPHTATDAKASREKFVAAVRDLLPSLRPMTAKRLRNVLGWIVAYVVAATLGLVLVHAHCQGTPWPEAYRAAVPLLLAIPAALFALVFPLRLQYMGRFHAVWDRLESRHIRVILLLSTKCDSKTLATELADFTAVVKQAVRLLLDERHAHQARLSAFSAFLSLTSKSSGDPTTTFQRGLNDLTPWIIDAPDL